MKLSFLNSIGGRLIALACLLLAGCTGNVSGQKATIDEAKKFVDDAEKRYLAVTINESRTGWVQSNFITDDTEVIAAGAKEETIKVVKVLAEEARKF
ncbi:MAG TPA: M2 family metallopeptidase, partial [Blastocatellia bacterium]|nr:M2 family metallopeptidase [Blastocatellia bacterium]